jgi:NAD(P)-dependent dehydrogenase (short-subunit alcohol dehydrogenase family)
LSERLKGKIAIVTGAGTGIGQAIAILFAHEGARVSICGRTPATLAETAHYIAGDGGEVIQLVYDISKADPIESMVLKTVERFGKLDILVNNA